MEAGALNALSAVSIAKGCCWKSVIVDILTFISESACIIYALHPAYIAIRVTALQPCSSAPETWMEMLQMWIFFCSKIKFALEFMWT